MCLCGDSGAFALCSKRSITAGTLSAFAAMSRLRISFFGSLALIGSGWVFAESHTATLESVIEKYHADVVLESFCETSPLFMSQAERRIAFAHFDALYPTRVIEVMALASPLPAAPAEFPLSPPLKGI